MSTLSSTFHNIQRHLFPVLEEEMGPLSEKERQFVRVLELTNLMHFITPYRWQMIGRRRQERLALAKAFIAKAVWNLPTTRALLDYLKSSPTLRRLCGWDSVGEIPSEATFSRAFEEFAQGQLPERLHEAMVGQYVGPKLIGHVSRDATAIEGREKPVKKEPKAKPEARKKGRPRKGEVRPPPEPKRLEVQPHRTLAENLADLPTNCDVGCKRNSQGYTETWIGYKLHLDGVDGDIPVSAILTSASVHDSQVAIPLAQKTFDRVQNLYDLMDAAYDAPQIEAFCKQLGHVPIIDPNPRGGEPRELEPAAQRRFAERSSIERVNSNLKDNFGGKFVRGSGSAESDVPFNVRDRGFNGHPIVSSAKIGLAHQVARLNDPTSAEIPPLRR
jgi:hypothetical protein